jgi:hypothetical protein
MAIRLRRLGEQAKSVWLITFDIAGRSIGLNLRTIFAGPGATLAEVCVHLCQAWKRRAVSRRRKDSRKGSPCREVLMIGHRRVVHVRRVLHLEEPGESSVCSDGISEVKVNRLGHENGFGTNNVA